jgi:hypothetical protein
MIFQALPTSAVLSLCLVSQQSHATSLPYLVRFFHGNCSKEKIWQRSQLFLKKITKYNTGHHVKSVLLDSIDTINANGLKELQFFISQLLPQTPNIQQLAIPGAPHFLSLLHDFPPQYLQALQCVYGEPGIWETICLFPRLSQLSLRRYL